MIIVFVCVYVTWYVDIGYLLLLSFFYGMGRVTWLFYCSIFLLSVCSFLPFFFFFLKKEICFHKHFSVIYTKMSVAQRIEEFQKRNRSFFLSLLFPSVAHLSSRVSLCNHFYLQNVFAIVLNNGKLPYYWFQSIIPPIWFCHLWNLEITGFQVFLCSGLYFYPIQSLSVLSFAILNSLHS